jgi:exonuclease III
LSGVFSSLAPAASERHKSFGVGTWNANGLFCISDYTKMCRKVKLLTKQIIKSNIYCVQEAHGNFALLSKHLRKVLLDYWVFSSFLSQGMGGVLVFVSKKTVPDVKSISCEALFAGRVLRLAISSICNNELVERQVIYNIHNFGIDQPSMRRICTRIRRDVNFAKNDPTAHSLFVLGDFNSSNF